MRWHCQARLLPMSLVAIVLWIPGSVKAAEVIKGVKQFNPEAETVELFSALRDGKLEVKLIPKDSKGCRLLIANKSQKPLNVSLPQAFAAVPVLAQALPGNFNNFNNFNDPNRNNLNNGTNTPQRLGVGNQFGNPNMMGNQGNQGNQFFNIPGAMPGGRNLGPGFAPFNIAPEKVAQLRLTSVCLDHGKPDPRPAISYQIEPIASVTDKAEVEELCRMLGRGDVSQKAAQAAAWHLENEMSWDALEAKQLKSAFGMAAKPFFTSRELAEGKEAVEKASELAKKRKKKPDKSYSISMR